LEVPLVGVPSLQAMALAVPAENEGCRCALVDARKGEFFVAAYDPEGRERLEVRLLAGVGELTPLLSGLDRPVLVGSGTAALPASMRVYRSAATDLPHARWVATAALEASPGASVRPLYVRDAGAVLPRLPQNPLSPQRSD
jgi:tRNA A37 threonylcarbamoyladenosine modification protein TsaB